MIWTQVPPVKSGTYWHWNGDDDCAPVPMFVGWSGPSGPCFVQCGQLGIREAIDCDEYGGWWMPLPNPLTPNQLERRHVQQRADNDCVIACVAMWTERGYERVAEKLKAGSLDCAVDYLKKEHGWNVHRHVQWYEYKPAILDVPSLNIPGGKHALFWDGRNLFDPNSGRPGRLVWTKELLDVKRSWCGSICEREV